MRDGWLLAMPHMEIAGLCQRGFVRQRDDPKVTRQGVLLNFTFSKTRIIRINCSAVAA